MHGNDNVIEINGFPVDSSETLIPHGLDITRIIGDDSQVIAFGELHSAPAHRELTTEFIQPLAQAGYNVLALEGISPLFDENLIQIKEAYLLSGDLSTLNTFVNQEYGNSIASPESLVNLIKSAFENGLTVIGIDAEKEELRAMIPDPTVMAFGDKTTADEFTEMTNLFQQDGIVAFLEQYGQTGIARLQELVKIVAGAVDRFQQASDELFLKHRDRKMNENLANYIGSHPDSKAIVNAGNRHLRHTEDSLVGLLRTSGLTTSGVIITGGSNTKIPSIENPINTAIENHNFDESRAMFKLGDRNWLIHIRN